MACEVLEDTQAPRMLSPLVSAKLSSFSNPDIARISTPDVYDQQYDMQDYDDLIGVDVADHESGDPKEEFSEALVSYSGTGKTTTLHSCLIQDCAGPLF